MRLELLKDAARIVVKLGTGVLTDSRKQPDAAQLDQLVGQVAECTREGREVVLVTSGAVGAGMGALGYEKRPGDLAALQACAAVGQSRLMATYEALFAKHNLHVGQVLLTHDDLQHHGRHLNARNTLLTLLQRKVVPIINENDAVSTTELKFGDNDKLSALVSCLLPADLLVILTTVDGVMENFGTPQARMLSLVRKIDAAVEGMGGGTQSATAVGGMASKLQAAKIVMRAGIPLVIASGRKPHMLRGLLAGAEDGTLFVPQSQKLKGRKRWIAFFHHPKGTLFVDEGARKALQDLGRSLLLPGISSVEGAFVPGEVVRVCDREGTEFARGIVACDTASVRDHKCETAEVIHRDNLVLL